MCSFFFSHNRIFLSTIFQFANLSFFFEGPTPEPPPPEPCKEHLDVGVIIDSSNSISPGDYNIARGYINKLARRMEISEAGTHMAILLYSWEAHTWHRLVDRVVELRPLVYILRTGLPFTYCFHLLTIKFLYKQFHL